MEDFDSIIGANFDADATPAHVFEYETLTVEALPAGLQKNRQWLLIAPDGSIAGVGPASGGGKSAMIAYAAENPGFRVANRRVTYGEWQVPTE